jgi:hypothetical protein
MASVILYLFPGLLPEARIAGDLNIEDVSCPYCEAQGICEHLVACIDPLNYDVGGRLHGLDREFVYRIKKAFLPLLQGLEGDPEAQGELAEPEWASEEIEELWQWAAGNWSPGDQDVEIDEDVLFRLISEILQEAAEHSDFASQLEGFGAETEYTLIYDDDPQGVLDHAIESLDSALKAKG